MRRPDPSRKFGQGKPATPARGAFTRVGQVVDVTPKGVLVKAPKMVPIGTSLVDARSQPAGRVVDVIGPVAAPYLLVNPGKGAKAQRLLRQDVFVP